MKLPQQVRQKASSTTNERVNGCATLHYQKRICRSALLERSDHDRRGRRGDDSAVIISERGFEEVDLPPTFEDARFRDVTSGAALAEITHLHFECRCDLTPFEHKPCRRRAHVVHHTGDRTAVQRAEAIELWLALFFGVLCFVGL